MVGRVTGARSGPTLTRDDGWSTDGSLAPPDEAERARAHGVRVCVPACVLELERCAPHVLCRAHCAALSVCVPCSLRCVRVLRACMRVCACL